MQSKEKQPTVLGRTNGHKTIAIPELRAAIDGTVILPGDTTYHQARTVFAGDIDRNPALIVRVANAEDVSHVVSLARETGLELAVRSGGHSTAGHSLAEGGIVIDLRDMNCLDIDPQSRTAWAETGLTSGEYTAAAGAHGLATGFGDTGSVGIGGITLGGGIGLLVRKHGLTIDSLLAADIVTADGRLRRVDSDNHPALYWAIRGGGGNFGVATRFKFQLHEVGDVVGGTLILPATAETIAAFIAAAEAAPDALSTIANVMPAPPMPVLPADVHGELVLLAMMVYAGDVEAGRRAIAPFRHVAEPLADLIQTQPYPEIFPPEDDDYHPSAVGHTMFMDHIDRDVATTILDYLRASTAPMRVAQLRVLGGAMARVPNDATAFAHRHSRIMANLAAFYNGPQEREARQDWVTAFAGDLHQGDAGAYVNFLGDEGPERVRAAYPGRTWDRLAAIKAHYDPSNLFRLNHNIPPDPL
jgi:FAD/FMN-containing dehydrogenase